MHFEISTGPGGRVEVGGSEAGRTPVTDAALWHAGLGAAVSNGPITYELDGEQYVIVGAGDTLWAFVMRTPPPPPSTSASAAAAARYLRTPGRGCSVRVLRSR